ncbi:sugar transporter domain-containing protein [Trichoderma breve]|uniref:Sugar transporter domain-containing protein n=3 Tax=Trichoderma TaxID=5543 RepID=A0A9W9BG05_9HYPO|nr:sugar transporter domain-containing protein [Trichoderma breve]KAF3069291.1 Carboxylic acid transporter protein [Trichoderma lentiforme]KAJ4859198.1 sugar transporter domain-containing protein [Trichoderma breve]OPB42541.1 MFS H+ sugar transporter [Trichoderma guizhouense]
MVGNNEEYWVPENYDNMSAGTYLATRFSSLKPPMLNLPNPWKLLRMLNRQQWAFFAIAFWAWTWDAFDFFTVSLTVADLAKQFDKQTTDITWGITLVLMFRSVGAILFGVAADRYGRKWPFIVNNLLFIALELGTGFCNTYKQFLACRALFGVAMGGLYGNAAATALEDCPQEARGIISGMLQQGYAFGYLLAAAFARGLVNTTSHGWRPLFWFGACPPVLFIAFRLMMPETQTYRERERMRIEAGQNRSNDESVGKVFIKEGKVAVKRHWILLTYLVLLMAGFNFMSHGSQDLYPTMLTNQLGFSADKVTVTQVVANLGAMTGGTIVGFVSQSVGRRFSIIICCIVGGALLYPYTFVHDTSIMAAAFFQQFCVQGAWGVIPIHLMELSPGAFRTFVVGTAYQLGNLVSSASSTIEARIGERFPLPPTASGTKRYDYGKVICIFMGCVYAYVLVLTFLGPEQLRKSFDVAYDHDAAEVAGWDDKPKAVHDEEFDTKARDSTAEKRATEEV